MQRKKNQGFNSYLIVFVDGVSRKLFWQTYSCRFRHCSREMFSLDDWTWGTNWCCGRSVLFTAWDDWTACTKGPTEYFQHVCAFLAHEALLLNTKRKLFFGMGRHLYMRHSLQTECACSVTKMSAASQTLCRLPQRPSAFLPRLLSWLRMFRSRHLWVFSSLIRLRLVCDVMFRLGRSKWFAFTFFFFCLTNLHFHFSSIIC